MRSPFAVTLFLALVACGSDASGPPAGETPIVPSIPIVTPDSGSPAKADGGAPADASPPVDATTTPAPAPAVTISVSPAKAPEGVGSLTFQINLSGPSPTEVSVGYTTLNGSAIAPIDYTASEGTVTFAPGDLVKTVSVPVTNDATYEGAETFTLKLSNGATATGTIFDDDAIPAVSISNPIVVEGTSAVFTITLASKSEKALVLPYQTVAGTALAGPDFTPSSGDVAFLAPGQTTATVTIPTINDATVESTESFTLAIGNVTGKCTIQDNDVVTPDPLPFVTVSDATVTEGGVLAFAVSLSASAKESVTVGYHTTDVTALAGTDYSSASGVIVFGPGETVKTINVVTTDDSTDEPDEVVFLEIASIDKALVSDGQATGTITDNDDEPVITIADASVKEGQAGKSSLDFTVSLSKASAETVSANWGVKANTAATPSDFVNASGVIMFPAGVTTKTITIQVEGDTLDEADETLEVSLSAANHATLGAKTQATGTIQNDDVPPIVSVSSENSVEGSSGDTTAYSFKVRLFNDLGVQQPSSKTVTVGYTTKDVTANAGTDYAALSGTLTFLPGETSKVVTVLVTADSDPEPQESFELALSGPSNAILGVATGIGTIINDDASPTLVGLSLDDPSVLESQAGSVIAFTVSLSAPAATDVTVNYATKSVTASTAGGATGIDYSAKAGTLTFAPGELNKVVQITVFGDAFNEADETFTLILSSPSANAKIDDDTGTGTILNDDPLPSIIIFDAAAVEQNIGATTLAFKVELSEISGQPVTVAFATSDVTAKAGSDYDAKTGVVTFASGEKVKTIFVTGFSDGTHEADEDFLVTLSAPSNVLLADPVATGTIENDDPVPSISIADVTLPEGTAVGSTTTFPFVVTLSNPSDVTISVDFSTGGDSAFPTADYVIKSGTLTFAPGETSKKIDVEVVRDSDAEADEEFRVLLKNPNFATLANTQAIGTIKNDD